MEGIDPPLFPAERAPLSKLPCGCIVHIEWTMDIEWKMSVDYCDWHHPLPSLPEGTILIR